MNTPTTTIPQYESVQDAYQAEFGHLDCADNFRAAEVGDIDSMNAYVERMNNGCCGYVDTVVSIAWEVMVGGEQHKYYLLHLLGCNYGH